MKNLFLLLLACVLLTFSATAQTAIARIKYEEAEEAFTKGEYSTTLTRLNEAEKILGATNPRILYLHIMATNKVVQPDPDHNFAQLQALRKHCALYLTKYETLENNEDKYRDVYKVSESLKGLPNTQADVEAHIRHTQTQLAERQAKLEQSRAFVDALVDKYKFKTGLTASEFRVYNLELQNFKQETVVGNVTAYSPKVNPKIPAPRHTPLGAMSFSTNATGKVNYYVVCIASLETKAEQSQAFDDFVAEMRSNLDPSYITQTDATRRMTPSELKEYKQGVAGLGEDAVRFGFGPPNDNDLEMNVPNAKALVSVKKLVNPYANPKVLLIFSNPD